MRVHESMHLSKQHEGDRNAPHKVLTLGPSRAQPKRNLRKPILQGYLNPGTIMVIRNLAIGRNDGKEMLHWPLAFQLS